MAEVEETATLPPVLAGGAATRIARLGGSAEGLRAVRGPVATRDGALS